MSLTNGATLLAGRRQFPNIPNLFLKYEAAAGENTLIESDTKITQLFDLSGNGRHATSAGETYEATGLSTSTPAIRTNGTRLNYGGSLTTNKVSFFWAAQAAILQVINSVGANSSEVNSIWTVNANSPLMRDTAVSVIAQGDFGAFDSYSDEVARSFAWVYDDTTNIRQFYANGILVQDSGDWSAGVAAGNITLGQIGRTTAEASNRIGAIVIYDQQLLTASQVLDLHLFYKNVKGII